MRVANAMLGCGAAGLLVGAMLLGACGDDSAETADSTDTYCRIAAELQQQEDFPSTAQLEAYRDAAPDDIADHVSLLVDRFIGAIEAGDPTAAYSDPEVEEAFGPVEAYEADQCGIEQLP